MDANACVMPILVVCDMTRGLFCGEAGLETESWFVTVRLISVECWQSVSGGAYDTARRRAAESSPENRQNPGESFTIHTYGCAPHVPESPQQPKKPVFQPLNTN